MGGYLALVVYLVTLQLVQLNMVEVELQVVEEEREVKENILVGGASLILPSTKTTLQVKGPRGEDGSWGEKQGETRPGVHWV